MVPKSLANNSVEGSPLLRGIRGPLSMSFDSCRARPRRRTRARAAADRVRGGIGEITVNPNLVAALRRRAERGFEETKTMPHHHVAAVVLAASVSLFAPYANAESVGPFAKMSGSWSGAGSLTMANGGQERLRCRANYN